MRKPVKGEKLWVVTHGWSSNKQDKGSECIVTKVGRKYFEARGIQFLIESWQENTEYTSYYTLYESKQAWLDEQEKDKYLDNFQQIFSHYSAKRREFTLNQLQKVAKILGIKIEER